MFNEIATDELSVFNEFSNRFCLDGKKVLEIGGSVPSAEVTKQKVKEWVSIDPLNDTNSTGLYKTIQGIASDISYPDEYFDYVFSCNAFEHIGDLNETILEIKRILKPSGKVFAHYGPIWSAPDGHHLDISFEGNEYNFWEKQIIPNWFHLIYGPEELKTILEEHYENNFVEKIIENTYKGSWINRLFYEDYLNIFIKSGLTIEYLDTTTDIDYPYNFIVSPSRFSVYDEKQVSVMLAQKYTNNYKNFSCRDIKVILVKY
ncbi:class I SAM-dependent methyltransferase [Virgibacillus pantothenticus]|uniref:class I SAM-dependent methyltransferase n=1 Tax=Virgibacillus pantothenticus TaxID=1473 RepID=UPI0014809FEB|nr:class I SAM-dependent methyltransferase [Virgibacillus pantothenticus]